MIHTELTDKTQFVNAKESNHKYNCVARGGGGLSLRVPRLEERQNDRLRAHK